MGRSPPAQLAHAAVPAVKPKTNCVSISCAAHAPGCGQLSRSQALFRPEYNFLAFIAQRPVIHVLLGHELALVSRLGRAYDPVTW